MPSRTLVCLAALALLVLGVGPANAQWGPETPLSSTGGDVYGEGIATAGATVHVIYGTGQVRYRASTDEGATWSTERTIDDGVLHLTDPLVADGADVWGIVLKEIRNVSDWCCVRDMGNIYLLHSGNAGGTWDTPVPLSTGRGAFRVSITYAASRLHLVWMDYRDGVWDTYYRRSLDRGATWQPEVRIARSMGTFGAERPQVAAQGDAVHVTIWDDRAPNPPCAPGTFTFTRCPDVFHIGSLDGGATWGPLTNVANAGAAFSGRNDIAVAGDSSVVINYNRDVTGTTGQKMFAVRSPDNGATWAAPVQLTTSPGESDHGSIIGAGSGVHLIWHDARDPSNLEIYYRGSTDAGATWDPEEQVSSGAAGDSSTPLLAVTAGYLHTMWIDRRGGTFQAYYRRRALAGPGGPDAGPGGGPDAGPGASGDAGEDPPGNEAGGCCGAGSGSPPASAVMFALGLIALSRRRGPRR